MAKSNVLGSEQERSKRIAAETGGEIVDGSQRQRSRQLLKRRRANGLVNQALAAMAAEQVLAVNREKMAAADQHATDCAPVRAELAKLEDAATQATLRDGEWREAATEGAKILALKARLNELNDRFTTAIEAADKKIAAIERDRVQFARKTAQIIEAEAELLRLGDPEKLKRVRYCQLNGGTDLDGRTVEQMTRDIIDE